MNRTKTLLAGAAAACALVSATGANAAITASSISGPETYSTDVSTYSTNVVCDFSAACSGGVTATAIGSAAIVTGNTAASAQPPGDTTAYMTVPGTGSAARITVAPGNVFSTFSYYMGSPDSYNGLSFYFNNVLISSLIGTQFGGATPNGDQTIGQRIAIAFNGANVDRIDFTSGSTAFEFDRVVATVSAVPEIATWGMMILGMGMVGAGLRLRRRAPSAVA